MAEMRAYLLARELGITCKELLIYLQEELNEKITNHQCNLPVDIIEKVRSHYAPSDPPREEKTQPREEEKATEETPVKETHTKEAPTKPREEKKPAPGVSAPKKKIEISSRATVKELAGKMDVSPSELITKLLKMGVVVTINQKLDTVAAKTIADEYGYELEIAELYGEEMIVPIQNEPEDLKPRPPVVTVLGHVDHGKTKLLDAIRNTNIAEGESGGITQRIGAYQVEVNNREIIFLDTPGHQAFTAMRARGAQVTDIVILVVAADDGVMPQTVEAIKHARLGTVPIIVAINKIDLPTANVNRVKQQLSEHNLIPEDWSGDTITVETSAKKNTGISELLEMILLQADLLELKASYTGRAYGTVLEAQVDRSSGNTMTVLVQNGKLKIGDPYVVGIYHGKVRALLNGRGERIQDAVPCMPIVVYGTSGLPMAGDQFMVAENEKISKHISNKRQMIQTEEARTKFQRATLSDLKNKGNGEEIHRLNLILKADNQGSIEALSESLEGIESDEVSVNIIHSQAGGISENDVLLAMSSNSIIIGFNVRPTPQAKILAEKESVEIRYYNVIYRLLDDIRAALEGMLSPDIEETPLGHAEVKKIFKVSKIGNIAGCIVTDGKVSSKSHARIIRDNRVIYTSSIASLRRIKDDVSEVSAGTECGILIDKYSDIHTGDIIETYSIKEIKRKITP